MSRLWFHLPQAYLYGRPGTYYDDDLIEELGISAGQVFSEVTKHLFYFITNRRTDKIADSRAKCDIR
jgi:hypothetical protein